MTATARNLEVPDTLAIRKAAQPVNGVNQYKGPRPTADDSSGAVVRGPWRRTPEPVALTPSAIARYRQRGRVLRSQAFRRMVRGVAARLRSAGSISTA